MPLSPQRGFPQEYVSGGNPFFAGACTHTFTQDMTMEPMVDHCAQFMEEIKKQSGQNLTKEQAKEMMHRFSPNLKRWKK
ncbi:MAG TPA: zinc ribbon domain-containing protein [Alloprevotella sp.]|nr:zinc ribbon domain-containing protein [Alloprevotella sp.]